MVAIEVKLSGLINDAHVTHLNWLRTELGDNYIDAVVLNTGPEAYRRRDGVAVIPLAIFFRNTTLSAVFATPGLQA